MPDGTARAIIRASRILAREAQALRFSPPVEYVYNPLLYAREPFERYIERYASGPRRVLLLGMNPGPWGMTQPGVPFGEVSTVREWLSVDGTVGQPDRPHPRVAVTGFSCRRSEVSGRRLWGLLREHYVSAAEMSRDLFVGNYCPLMFLDGAGKNVTPDRIAAPDRAPLYALCDRFLLVIVKSLQPRWVTGVGRFAARRAEEALASAPVSAARPGADVRVATLPHPSPANPAANRDWAGQAGRVLREQGIWEGQGGGNP